MGTFLTVETPYVDGQFVNAANLNALVEESTPTAGTVVQTVNSTYATNATIATAIPLDDTIPQNAEGTEIVAGTITLKYDTSKIEISFSGQCSALIAGTAIVALFKDTDVSSIQASCVSIAGANTLHAITLPPIHQTPGTVGPFTYKVRAGLAVAGTLRFNGTSAARLFGGVSVASLTLKEIK